MTAESKGHFAKKHPPGTTVNEKVKQVVEENLIGGCIDCDTAYSIAEKLGVSPMEIGTAIDLMEGRITKCQLGLFGYGKGKKKIKASKSILPSLRSAIENALKDDVLSCAAIWRIAQEQSIPRLSVANACEMLGVRIRPCQLGAFKSAS